MSSKKYLGEAAARELTGIAHDNADNIATLAEIAEGLAATKADVTELDTAYERTWNIESYAQLRQLVQSGRHLKKLRYGDIIVVDAAEHLTELNDGETELIVDGRTLTEYRFRVQGLDEEEPADPSIKHTLTLKCIEPIWPKSYNREVVFAAQGDMPAGVYTITVPADCGYKTEEAVFKIGVTQPLEAGDWVAFSNHAEISPNSPTRYTMETSVEGVTFYANFATDEDLEENIEQYTSLGKADGTVTGINFFAHALTGGSEYSLSDVRVWANSNKSAAELEAEWTSDAPYAIKPKSFDDGFLYLLDPDFVDTLVEVKKKTIEYALDGTATIVESTEKAFLESYTEIMGEYHSTWRINGVTSGAVFEGEKYGYYNHFGYDLIGSDGTAYGQLLRSVHDYYNTPLVTGRSKSERSYAFPCVVIG